MPRHSRSCLLALFVLLLAGCGHDEPVTEPVVTGEPDRDRDGFVASLDCNEADRSIFPGAPEPCDGVDNDCDGLIDEDWDRDGDFWTTCAGDCRDNDPTSYPGADEILDSVDNDCDGRVDNHSDTSDDDGDGYSEDQGDCNDDPTAGGALTGPGAIEVQVDSQGNPEGMDNDCDGLIDEALPPCPSGPEASDPMDPWSFANAIEACHAVTDVFWNQEASIDDLSRNIVGKYGTTYTPRAGQDFMVLSTGIAVDMDDPRFVEPQDGTAFRNRVRHPDPLGAIGCGDPDPAWVNDYTEVVMRIEVPSNASAFSFDFNFMSTEFPEWVCSEYDDTFLAMLESDAFSGNVSFDALGNRMSINVGFFDVCAVDEGDNCTGSAELAGTGYESDGGGTGWLTTTAPVIGGEKITLRFLIFDEGDRAFDSAVLIDNFRWEIEEFHCPGNVPPPCTIDRRAP